MNPALNVTDREVLGQIIIREIRRRTRAGQSYTGSRFRRYSRAYTTNLQRLGLSTSVDLDRTGQMLSSVRILRHGQGFIIIGINSQDRGAIRKARATQDGQNQPARLWLGISNTFVNRQQSAILKSVQAADSFEATADDIGNLPSSGNPDGATSIGIDISPEADASRAINVLGAGPDNAGQSRADRLLRIRNRLMVDNLSSADRRVLQRERSRQERLDRASQDTLEAEALAFIRQSPNLSSQLPTFGRRIGNTNETLVRSGEERISSIEAIPIQSARPQVVTRFPGLQARLDAIPETAIELTQARIDRLAAEAIRMADIDSFEGPRTAFPLDPRNQPLNSRGYSSEEIDFTNPKRIQLESQTQEYREDNLGAELPFEQIQGNIDRNLGVVRGDQLGRNQTSLTQKRAQEVIDNAARNTLIRRQERELERLDAQRLRDRGESSLSVRRFVPPSVSSISDSQVRRTIAATRSGSVDSAPNRQRTMVSVALPPDRQLSESSRRALNNIRRVSGDIRTGSVQELQSLTFTDRDVLTAQETLRRNRGNR